jgi:NAD-dependent SIR2 family protein deacetylase
MRSDLPREAAVSDRTRRTLRRVAQSVNDADALLITAGAGMSADSGMPVFRGNEGFWRAYPPLQKLGISFERMAQPVWFSEKPRMAWAFYGHRLQLYREAKPHAGYGILRGWCDRMSAGCFVVTSNVDGHFLATGFPPDGVVEQHGRIGRLQCTVPCTEETWETPVLDLQVDMDCLEARGELPLCPKCGALARPNILMFNDADWVRDVTQQQTRRLDAWLAGVRGRRLVVVELGAGRAIQTIRALGERTAQRPLTTLVRINPDASEFEETLLPLPLPALQALSMVDQAMTDSSGRKSSALRTLPPREMPSIEFPKEDKKRDLASEPTSITYIDLRSGYVQSFDPEYLLTHEVNLCLDQWHIGQNDFVPLPTFRGIDLPGFTMQGQVVNSPELKAGGTPGAGLLRIKGPRGELVATVGFARRQLEGAYVWRLLHKEASAAIQALDCPVIPWIARRVDPGAARNVAVLGLLSTVECAVATSWLKYQDFLEHDPPLH